MRLWLAPHIHAVAIEDEIVFLDVAADAYFCLVQAARHLALEEGGGVSASHPAATRDLLAAGVLVAADPKVFRRRVPPLARDLDAVSARPARGGLLTALAANQRAARAVADLPLAQILALAGPGQAAALEPPSDQVLAQAAGFGRLAPWLPRDGLCLMRSLQQRLFLAARGAAVAWVFGVRTWPFQAHCWLQAGDLVLDDSLAHARGFSPILVV
ncbi:lasso peptide biosynthesis B2 protein [Caulobacter sp. LARHSG274]